jgi:hypothetical protein
MLYDDLAKAACALLHRRLEAFARQLVARIRQLVVPSVCGLELLVHEALSS